jgi:Flp pilus assembly protein TadD
MMLAIARTYTGDARGAESLYVSLADRTPDDPLVWVGLAGSAIRLGDSTQATRALAKLGSYAPEGHEVRLIRRHLRMFPEVWPPDRRTP